MCIHSVCRETCLPGCCWDVGLESTSCLGPSRGQADLDSSSGSCFLLVLGFSSFLHNMRIVPLISQVVLTIEIMPVTCPAWCLTLTIHLEKLPLKLTQVVRSGRKPQPWRFCCVLPRQSPAYKWEGSRGPPTRQAQVKQKPLSLAALPPALPCPSVPRLHPTSPPRVQHLEKSQAQQGDHLFQDVCGDPAWLLPPSPGAGTYMSYRALIPAFPKLYLVSVPESPSRITMSFHREAYTKARDAMSAQVNAKAKRILLQVELSSFLSNFLYLSFQLSKDSKWLRICLSPFYRKPHGNYNEGEKCVAYKARQQCQVHLQKRDFDTGLGNRRQRGRWCLIPRTAGNDSPDGLRRGTWTRHAGLPKCVWSQSPRVEYKG